MTSRLRAEALPEFHPHRRRRRSPRAGASEAARQEGGLGGHRDSSSPRSSRLPRNLVGLSVVVVDDDEDTLEYFAVALRSCGATVATASTAVDALGLVLQGHPHVVLSDIAMVGHDGYWLVREIRGLAEAAVPVVAATAYGRDHSRARALEAGFTELLAKPIEPELLCQAIARAAGR